MEIPMDLIKQVQISLRNNSKLSSYNPGDTSLPSLPSVEEAIAALDPSPSYLRCKHCDGRLLRGVQSLICVFCGKEACKDVPPDPINFHDTLGCRWLLDSLDLDGSETVGPLVESNNLSTRQAAPKDEFPLSNLLDLEIKWCSKLEKVGANLSNETLVPGISPLNLGGANIEDFFAEGKRNNTSNTLEESSVNVKQTESKGSTQSSVKINLFENVQPSENAVVSTRSYSSYSDSDWATNFRSASSASLQNESTSHDPFVGSTADISSHIDEVFGATSKSNETKEREIIGSASVANDWSQDDLWSNPNLGSTGQPEEFKRIANSEARVVESVNSSPNEFNFFQDNQLKSSSDSGLSNKTNNEGKNLFDDWNDFTSSTSAQDPSTSRENQTVVPSNDQISATDLFSSIDNSQDIDFGNFSQPDIFSGAISNSNGSAEGKKMQLESSILNRMVDANYGDTEEGVNTSSEKVGSKANDVEMLLSQMHDLSFMLESNLSIPPKEDKLNSSTQY